MEKGQVISGRFGEIKARQKADAELELGELLIAEAKDMKILLQVYDLQYGSQISEQNLELISGMQLEERAELDFMDPDLRNYTVAFLKNLIDIKDGEAKTSKTLPSFFSTVRDVTKDDVSFLQAPQQPLFFGKLRSGTKELDVDIHLDGEDVFRHHILITGTTGKGKSVLMSNLLWDATSRDYCASLVLDPHDEYFGRTTTGLKDHPDGVQYYSSQDVPPGGKTLTINVDVLKPGHFGFMSLSRAQNDAMYAYYKQYRSGWINALMSEDPLEGAGVQDVTKAVLRRKLSNVLDIVLSEDGFRCTGVFTTSGGESTISGIVNELEDGETVVIDTSNFAGQVELLVGSLIASELFRKYKYYKRNGELGQKPVVSIVLEEAPRVLGKDVLESGTNIFSTLAREGRKFKVGLSAITQLPSLIPREILANMNTKIILGTEMNTERQAIIESASQDLSNDSRAIASLDKGEAILSSNFGQFAIPLSIPYFPEWVGNERAEETVTNSFEGMS
jgi:hypothetical protein